MALKVNTNKTQNLEFLLDPGDFAKIFAMEVFNHDNTKQWNANLIEFGLVMAKVSSTGFLRALRFPSTPENGNPFIFLVHSFYSLVVCTKPALLHSQILIASGTRQPVY